MDLRGIPHHDRCSSGRREPRRRTRFLSCRSRAPSRARFLPGAWGSFFKILDRALRLRMVARSGREFAVAHGAQLPAERLLGDRDAEFLEDPFARSISRQRTTPWTAGIGPLSIMPAMASRWRSLSLDGLPGDLPFRRASGPRALKRNTQSRMI